MTAVALCHLARKANGIEPFDRFISSYEQHGAGVDHDLVIIFKGFGGPEELEPYRRRLRGHAFEELQVPDDGLDLGAYFAAARELDQERLCFVNSFSRVLANGWLGHLDAALSQEGTGLVGATGSWASHRSAATYLLGLGGSYRTLLGPRSLGKSALASVAAEPAGRQRFRKLHAAANIPRELLLYPSFPDPHIRSNAFLVFRELFMSVKSRSLMSKPGAYSFEAGRRSMTRQVLDRGFDARIVDATGESSLPGDWPELECYWQGSQRALLVADNQTLLYGAAPLSTRQVLSAFAWGNRAWS